MLTQSDKDMMTSLALMHREKLLASKLRTCWHSVCGLGPSWLLLAGHGGAMGRAPHYDPTCFCSPRWHGPYLARAGVAY